MSRVMMLACVGLVLAVAGVVNAHVTLYEANAYQGIAQYITFQIPHACGLTNTVALSVRIPTNVTAQPVSRENWTLNRTFADGSATRVQWYTWATTGPGLIPWQLHTFSMKVTFGASFYPAGSQVFFQTIQYCRNDSVTGDQYVDYWTLVAYPTGLDVDQSLANNPLAETSPSIIVLAQPKTTVPTTNGTVIIQQNTYMTGTTASTDSWSGAYTIAVVAIILAVITIAFVLMLCNRKAPAAVPAGSGATFSQVSTPRA